MAAGRYRRSVDDGDDHTSGGEASMRLFQIATAVLTFLSMDYAMAQERIRISSDWGNVTAELADNAAARSLIQMLPITIDMRDHMRQEKTGQPAITVAGDCPAARFRGRNTWALGSGSLRYLLSQWPRPSAGHRHSGQGDRRCLNLRPSGFDCRSRRARIPVSPAKNKTDRNRSEDL